MYQNWSDMSAHGLLFQRAITRKIQLMKRVGLVQSRHYLIEM